MVEYIVEVLLEGKVLPFQRKVLEYIVEVLLLRKVLLFTKGAPFRKSAAFRKGGRVYRYGAR